MSLIEFLIYQITQYFHHKLSKPIQIKKRPTTSPSQRPLSKTKRTLPSKQQDLPPLSQKITSQPPKTPNLPVQSKPNTPPMKKENFQLLLKECYENGFTHLSKENQQKLLKAVEHYTKTHFSKEALTNFKIFNTLYQNRVAIFEKFKISGNHEGNFFCSSLLIKENLPNPPVFEFKEDATTTTMSTRDLFRLERELENAVETYCKSVFLLFKYALLTSSFETAFGGVCVPARVQAMINWQETILISQQAAPLQFNFAVIFNNSQSWADVRWFFMKGYHDFIAKQPNQNYDKVHCYEWIKERAINILLWKNKKTERVTGEKIRNAVNSLWNDDVFQELRES